MQKSRNPDFRSWQAKKKTGKVCSHRPGLRIRWHFVPWRARFYCTPSQIHEKHGLCMDFSSQLLNTVILLDVFLSDNREVYEKVLQTPLRSSAGGSMASALLSLQITEDFQTFLHSIIPNLPFLFIFTITAHVQPTTISHPENLLTVAPPPVFSSDLLPPPWN